MTKVSELGERKVIEKIIKILEKHPQMALPFGDDVAAINISDRLIAVLKTDMLVGKTDIPPGMTLRQAARKAVIMNISDFAAKGVKPLALLASLGLPRNTTEKDVEEIGRGLNEGAREYETYIVGGDTSEALDIIICCMVFGTSKSKELMKRSGAEPGDILTVTGLFGKTAAGLKILLEGFPTVKENSSILDSVYMPKARLREGLTLRGTGAVSASIDSSDGLAVSLHELSKMSNVGFELTEMPIAQEAITFADENKLNADDLALYGGEEYELVLTVKPAGWDESLKAVKKVEGTLIPIGRVTKKRSIVIRRGDTYQKILYRGYEHFKD